MRKNTGYGKKLLLLLGFLTLVCMPTIVVLTHPQTARAQSLSSFSKEGDTDSAYRGSGR